MTPTVGTHVGRPRPSVHTLRLQLSDRLRLANSYENKRSREVDLALRSEFEARAARHAHAPCGIRRENCDAHHEPEVDVRTVRLCARCAVRPESVSTVMVMIVKGTRSAGFHNSRMLRCVMAASEHCYARVVTDGMGRTMKANTPSGFGPPDLASAYKLDTSLKPGATIAIVDAYDYPNAESDLAKYRSQYGLPACTTRERLLQERQPERRGLAAARQRAGERRLDGRDRARSRHGERRVPELQADPRRGRRRSGRRPVHRATTARRASAPTVISNSWGGPEHGSESSVRDVLQPLRHRHLRRRRRQRLQRRRPGPRLSRARRRT